MISSIELTLIVQEYAVIASFPAGGGVWRFMIAPLMPGSVSGPVVISQYSAPVSSQAIVGSRSRFFLLASNGPWSNVPMASTPY